MLVRSKGPLIIQEFNTHMIKHFTFTQSALINIKIKVSVRSRTAQTFIPPLWWVGWGGLGEGTEGTVLILAGPAARGSPWKWSAHI